MLSEYHPDLAATYNNLGQLWASMGEQSKALSFYQRATGVAERSLPENHPDLQMYRGNLICVSKNL
jgi:hypothetical protein